MSLLQEQIGDDESTALQNYSSITAEQGTGNHERSELLNAAPNVSPIDATASQASYWGLWKNHKEYRWYLMSSLVTDAGEWFSYIASIATIEEIHVSNNQEISRTSISILIALRLVPNALFSNIGGVLADSYDRRNMLLVLDVLGAVTACFFLLAYQVRYIPALYAATVCQMTIAAMYEPCRSAFVPMLITTEAYLKKALTLTGLTWSIMASVGASTGGLFTEYFGINACFVVDSATYLLSACFISRIRGRYLALKRSEGDEMLVVANAFTDTDTSICALDETSHLISLSEAMTMTVNGFKYLKSQPWGAFVFLKGCAGLIYGTADILNVAFSERGEDNDNNVNLDGSSGRLGILFGSVGVGCLIGPIISEKFTDMENASSLEGACLISYLLMAIGYYGLARVEGFVSVCIFTSVRAAGSSIVWIYSSLLLQKFCLNEMLGRVMAVDYALATLSEAISAMSGGLLQDKAGMSAENISSVMTLIAIVTLVLWAVYFCRVRM